MKCIFLFTAVTYFFTACHQNDLPNNNGANKEPRRFGMVTGLKKEKLEYYKQLHAKVWPQVLQKITACNIRNYSIYIKEIDSSYFLFSYFEYTGNDFDADMKKMSADTVTQRWWKETNPCQRPLPDAAKQGKIWTTMDEVFHEE